MSHIDSIIFEVVTALAAADGVTPKELEYTLADHVSPYVLEKVVSEDHHCELTFQVPGHAVTVTDEGVVYVDGVRYGQDHDVPIDLETHADLRFGSEYLHYRGLIDSLPCTVYQSRDEPGWPIDFISDSCRDITGYDPNAFIVGGVTFGFDLIHPDDREKVSERAAEAVENDEPFTVTYRILTADGSEKWVVERGVPLIGDGRQCRFVGVITDITDLVVEQPIPNDVSV